MGERHRCGAREGTYSPRGSKLSRMNHHVTQFTGLPHLSRRIGDEDRAEDRAGELARQAIHIDPVVERAVQQRALAATTELLEPGLAIGRLPRQVVTVGREHDAVQPEGGEGVVEHQPRRLGAIALAACVGLADDDAETGGARAPVHVEEIGPPDGPPARPLVDGEPVLVPLARIVGRGQGFERARAGGTAEGARNGEVIAPAREERQVLPHPWPERHPLAGDVDDRLRHRSHAPSYHAAAHPAVGNDTIGLGVRWGQRPHKPYSPHHARPRIVGGDGGLCRHGARANGRWLCPG